MIKISPCPNTICMYVKLCIYTIYTILINGTRSILTSAWSQLFLSLFFRINISAILIYYTLGELFLFFHLLEFGFCTEWHIHLSLLHIFLGFPIQEPSASPSSPVLLAYLSKETKALFQHPTLFLYVQTSQLPIILIYVTFSIVFLVGGAWDARKLLICIL